MIAHVSRTARRRLRRSVLLAVVALLTVLLSRPLAGQTPTVQAQDFQIQVYTRCVAIDTPTFTVPAGVTKLRLEVQGAAGGWGDGGFLADSGRGGTGAVVVGDVAVTPGQQLRIYVGCTGQREGAPGNGHGYTNGGSRGRARGESGSGGTGGGSSAVTTAAGEVLIAAGGGGAGGGGGITGAGGDGGDAGAAPQPGEGGDGPGRGDGGCAACVGGMMAGRGTNSSWLEDGGGGGGGGGGYCGPSCQDTNNGGGGHGAGEGGGGGGGGGAGSSYAAPAVTNTSIGRSPCGDFSCDGQVTIRWTPAALDGAVPGPEAPAPMTISGQVQHVVLPLVSENQIEHSLIPHTGATVEALVGDTVCGTAVTDTDGRFELTVAAHPTTPGCGQSGTTVRFRVDSADHPESVPFRSGGTATVVLRSSDAPAVTPRWP